MPAGNLEMPSLEFETDHKYPDDRRGITVSVELQAGRAVRLPATVDTGAENCIFQAEYAEQLGLNLQQGHRKTFSAAGVEQIVAYGHEVTLTVLGHSVNSMVYFTDHPGFARNVLGRQGWLHHFKFGLIHYRQQLYLGRYET